MSGRIRVALLALTLGIGPSCQASPQAPSSPAPNSPLRAPSPSPPPSPPSSASVLAALLGQWTGSSAVQSVNGVLPSCVPTFWQRGFGDTISAELLPLKDTTLAIDLHIRLDASNEFCHLKVTGSESGVVARSFDEEDLGFEGEAWCHFRLQTATWGCPGVAPEVWIAGINLTGTFPNESRRQIQGMLEIPYDHRPGNSPREVHYDTMTIVKWFALTKIST